MLYLVATPIGNLEDMTYRAVRVLGAVDFIAAEDTRHTRGLLTHFDIHTPMVSYHEHNKFEQGPKIIERLLAGESVACVSDAGLPGIADPGAHLAELALAEGIRVSPLPGANAALSALICSGRDTRSFTFHGFLPKTKAKRMELLEKLKMREETLIFYEAPHHLKDTLKTLTEVFGKGRQATLARELTKKFEEFLQGSLEELLLYYKEHEVRGEFVIVLAGASGEIEEGAQEENRTPIALFQQLSAEGMEKKAAMREVARRLSISRRDVYKQLLKEDISS